MDTDPVHVKAGLQVCSTYLIHIVGYPKIPGEGRTFFFQVLCFLVQNSPPSAPITYLTVMSRLWREFDVRSVGRGRGLQEIGIMMGRPSWVVWFTVKKKKRQGPKKILNPDSTRRMGLVT